ncbi:MAG: queuosine precursor transporter [Chlamydiota bacterium]
MNEALFLGHILLVLAFVLGALRLGKNCLIAIISLQAVLANLFVVKQMDLLGFSVTCSDVFAIGGILALNLLQEYFGKESAALAVKISFFSLIFFAVMSQIHLLYAPNIHDSTHLGFQTVFSATPRVVGASILVFYLVQKMDLQLFGFLKNLCQGKKLGVRIGISLLVSQFFDTVLFSFLGLYGLLESLFDIILISFLVKCLIIACSSPFVVFSRRFVKEEA